MIAQTKRDVEQTRRIWIYMCKRNGWLDDIDMLDDI